MDRKDEVAAVIRQQAGFVFRVLRHLGVPDDQLQDAAQEVFLVILRRLHSFEGRSELTTWIYGICRNMALRSRHAARAARARELVTGEPPEGAAAETQTSSVQRRQALARLYAALQELQEPTRMVFVLFEIQRLPMAEVAAVMGCTRSTAYSRLYAARAHVEDALARAGILEPAATILEAT